VSRVRFAAKILESLKPSSLLDIGCRDTELSRYVQCEYRGADIFPGERVSYVGNVEQLNIDRSFDAVVALDILEHLDGPSEMFDRLFGLANRHVLISLPNCYDLRSRMTFATKGRLSDKYAFTEEPPQDRHRWLMGRKEIIRIAEVKATKHGADLALFEMYYGSGGRLAGKMLSGILPRSLTATTVFALFTKKA
jgi:hypothetical protein